MKDLIQGNKKRQETSVKKIHVALVGYNVVAYVHKTIRDVWGASKYPLFVNFSVLISMSCSIL